LRSSGVADSKSAESVKGKATTATAALLKATRATPTAIAARLLRKAQFLSVMTFLARCDLAGEALSGLELGQRNPTI
jgi:hypothetical protein